MPIVFFTTIPPPNMTKNVCQSIPQQLLGKVRKNKSTLYRCYSISKRNLGQIACFLDSSPITQYAAHENENIQKKIFGEEYKSFQCTMTNSLEYKDNNTIWRILFSVRGVPLIDTVHRWQYCGSSIYIQTAHNYQSF